MWGMTATLTDDQIQGLARYYSARKTTPVTSGHLDPASMSRGKTIFENGLPEKQAAPCMACHGAKAEGMAGFPRLGGQHQAYIVRQLRIFQDNVGRPGTPMNQIAHGLDSKDMEDVAAYLQSLGG
jgi:cytochrome c553